jgi:hypothetical protein
MRLTLIVCALLAVCASGAVRVDGEMRRWSTITLTFDGPQASEDAQPNPFRDYRLNVVFRHAKSGKSFTVPGYFAADGNAAETSAKAGTKWRVHFTPGEEGAWEYQASFRQGTDVALSTDSAPGQGTAFDGERGSLRIRAAAAGARGLLHYTGGHYLQYSGNGEYSAHSFTATSRM